MNKRMLTVTSLMLILATTVTMKTTTAVDTLAPNDFKLQSFSKTVDFFSFCRNFASAHNKTGPPSNWHAYLYQNYINVSGFQLYYSGLINITAGSGGALTIPVQSFIEHYKTPNGKDVLTSSSFIMLLAFNDTDHSGGHDDSPDRYDNLYASFSLGYDLTSIYGDQTKPSLSSKTTIIQLTKSGDNRTWEWGMKYTNLTAVWWRMFTNNATFNAVPVAITTYDELTFTYKLTISPGDNKATLTSNYVVGRMTNLWVFQWFFIPIVVHYNSTGAYRLNGIKLSDETIYQYLERQHIKMSIVLFQNSLVLDYTTKSMFNNQNVTDAEVNVSNGAIVTEAGNEDIFKAEFGTKKQYNLYNYTADPTETDYDTYHAVTRTAPRAGYARNPLFSMHAALLKYVPVIVKHVAPQLYQKAINLMCNMTYSDYFYLISYPKYSGFKVEHDPTYTAYIATPPTSPTGTTGEPSLSGIFGIVIIAVIVVAVVGTVLVLRKRGAKTASTVQPTAPTQPSPPSPPTTSTT